MHRKGNTRVISHDKYLREVRDLFLALSLRYYHLVIFLSWFLSRSNRAMPGYPVSEENHLIFSVISRTSTKSK